MSWKPIDDNGRKVILRWGRRCEWCNQWIEKREQAVVRVYSFNGEFHSARMHPECYTAMMKSLSDMPDDEFEPGDQGRGCLINVL